MMGKGLIKSLEMESFKHTACLIGFVIFFMSLLAKVVFFSGP